MYCLEDHGHPMQNKIKLKPFLKNLAALVDEFDETTDYQIINKDLQQEFEKSAKEMRRLGDHFIFHYDKIYEISDKISLM